MPQSYTGGNLQQNLSFNRTVAPSSGFNASSVYGSLLAGVSSYLDDRNKQKLASMQSRARPEFAREAGRQERANMAFTAALESHSAQEDRKKKSDALREYLTVARKRPTGGALNSVNRMVATDSPWQVPSAGALPVAASFTPPKS